jgi:heavy metal sensor kinase
MTWRWRKRDLRRLSRGLRFRLTASYAILFLLILIGVATGFRWYLQITLDEQVEENLNDYYIAAKGGYLRIFLDRENHQYFADWYYEDADPDERTLVGEIKKVFLLADYNGNVLLDYKTKERQISSTFEDIGIDKPAIRRRIDKYKANPKAPADFDTRRDSDGIRYRIRGGVILNLETQEPFYFAVGQSLESNDKILARYTFFVYSLVIPGALVIGSLLGWMMAGSVLTPVREVAQAAQRITGSNLSLRIPTRQADDELDYLILTFNRMIDRLEASFQQMKQFSTDVSHELRTPITGIRGQLEVALFTAKTTDQYREAMFNALQDIDRLSQIVRALLLLSQAESGQLVLQKTRLDMSEVIRDLVEQFQIPAEAAGVRLTAESARDCFLDGDRVQIERMITNLLSNAVKFTPEGGSVEVSAHSFEDHVEIIVEDTGRGIPAEHLPHIFDRFYRVTGSGTAPVAEQGLGLGLSFVAWIAKAHGGSVEVDSMPGKGTRFTIKLPTEPRVAGSRELAGQPAVS